MCAPGGRTALRAHRVHPPGVRAPQWGGRGVVCRGLVSDSEARAAWTRARPGAGLEEGGGGAQLGLAEWPRPAAPPPLVPLNSWAAVSALTAPSAASRAAIAEACLGAAPGDRRPAVEPGAGPPLSSGWRSSEPGHHSPRHGPTAEAAAPDPCPGRGCGPGAWAAVLRAGQPGSRPGAGSGGPGPRFGTRSPSWGSDALPVSSRACSWRGRPAPKALR